MDPKKKQLDAHNCCGCVDERLDKRSLISSLQCPLAHQLLNHLAIVLRSCQLMVEAGISENVAEHFESILTAVREMTASLEQCRSRKS